MPGFAPAHVVEDLVAEAAVVVGPFSGDAGHVVVPPLCFLPFREARDHGDSCLPLQHSGSRT